MDDDERVLDAIDGLHRKVDRIARSLGAVEVERPRGRKARLSVEDVRGVQFPSRWFARGYGEAEVDAFLDEVEAEIARLTRERDRAVSERERLRAELAEVRARSG